MNKIYIKTHPVLYLKFLSYLYAKTEQQPVWHLLQRSIFQHLWDYVMIHWQRVNIIIFTLIILNLITITNSYPILISCTLQLNWPLLWNCKENKKTTFNSFIHFIYLFIFLVTISVELAGNDPCKYLQGKHESTVPCWAVQVQNPFLSGTLHHLHSKLVHKHKHKHENRCN